MIAEQEPRQMQKQKLVGSLLESKQVAKNRVLTQITNLTKYRVTNVLQIELHTIIGMMDI